MRAYVVQECWLTRACGAMVWSGLCFIYTQPLALQLCTHVVLSRKIRSPTKSGPPGPKVAAKISPPAKIGPLVQLCAQHALG
jgi:hypothetical protein